MGEMYEHLIGVEQHVFINEEVMAACLIEDTAYLENHINELCYPRTTHFSRSSVVLLKNPIPAPSLNIQL